jgi:nuclear pore complex protein Nup188
VHRNVNDTSSQALALLSTPSAEQILSISKLLSRPVPIFHTPSSRAKTEFESRTSAINVTPIPDAAYSIEEIKEDTLWLSNCLDLDELECLRIVVLEWQTRPAVQLQQGLSETEAASLRDALGSDDYNYDLGKSTTPGPGKLADPAFHSRDRRRTRLLALCMREQGSMFRISAVLTDLFVQLDLMVSSGVELHPSATQGGRIKTAIRGSLQSSKTQQLGLVACLEGLKECLENLSKGYRWADETFDSSQLQDDWACVCLHQVASLLELVLLHYQTPGAYTESNHVLAWLRLMSEVNFFLSFEPQSSKQAMLCSKIQALASTCTLAMLYLSDASDYIERVRASPETQLDRNEPLPYFMDPEAAAEIHQLMLSFGAATLAQAAPAVLAWGLILGNIREIAVTSRDLREASHVQKAIDGGSRDSPSGRRLSSSSIGSIQQSSFEDVMDSIRAVGHGEDDGDDLIRSAVQACNVFQYIASICASESSRSPIGTTMQGEIFQQLIITSIAQLQSSYSGDVVAAQLALVEALAEVAGEFRASGDVYALKMRKFHEESGVREVLELAASRFPYETLPFLRLCDGLARLGCIDDSGYDWTTTFLRDIRTFTQKTSPSFSAYHTTLEYQNANLISLDAHLDMLDTSESQRLLDFQGRVTELKHTIPSGTIGEVMTEERPPVIKWHHSYSGLAFLGLWLDGFRRGQIQGLHLAEDDLEATAASMLELLSLTISSAYREGAAGLEKASSLLDEIGSGSSEDIDISSMVFDICEQHLQSLRYRKQNWRSCDVLVACLKLITILLPITPSKVWSSLSRSTLVDTRGNGGGAIANILSLETTREECGFLEAYTELYRALVEDALRQAVGSDSIPASGRVVAFDIATKGTVPTRIVSSVMQTSTRVTLDAFRAASQWKTASSGQMIGVSMKLSQVFQSILEYVYGADDSANLSTKLTAGLATSAAYIAAFLRPHQDEVSGALCLLRWLLIAWQESTDVSTIRESLAISTQCCAILGLTRTVLRVGTYLDLPESALEAQILDALPVLVRVSTLDGRCLLDMLKVVQALLGTMSPENTPPLLGRLGSASAIAFLESIYPLIRPSEDDKISFPEGWNLEFRPLDSELQLQIWEFFTSLITQNQQWFAFALLKGSPPDFLRKADTKSEAKHQISLRGKAILAEALDHFVATDRLNLRLAVAVLNFVVKSQTYWNWVIDSIQAHPTLLPNLITFVSNMKLNDSNQLVQSQYNAIASLVVELATVQLHYARSRGDKAKVQRMIPLMGWLTSNAISVNGYNISLHSNLSKNFSARYEACTLANFKRTQLFERPYGSEYFYDLDLAGKMLSHGSSQSRRPDFDKTFHQEIIRVNLNLSLVDSQLLLLDSFQLFCIEHATPFSQDPQVQKMMVTVIQNLLTANTTSPPLEQLFETLFQTRAEFALVLIRRLAQIKARGSEFTGLLSAAWSAVRYRNASYEFAIANDDLVYFRTTLSILLLAMQFHTDRRSQNHDKLALVSTQRDPTASIILEVASVIVSDGMRSIVSSIHDQTTTANGASSDSSIVDTKDVSLVLTVLQTMLRLHILPQIISQLGSGFASSSVVQSCLLLYSWSHTLTTAETSNEQMYADLSLRFLVSLSSLPQVAEELAVEGVLSRISTARVTQLLRTTRGGVSQFDKRPFVASLYGVWSNGILPLCLNLLHSVGRAMAGEVATFLNQFSCQLSRATKAFSYHSAVGEPLTLALANEGAVLALISRVLSNYRMAGASAGVDAYEVPALEGYDDQRSVIVEDIKEILVGGKLKVRATSMSEKEAAWQKMKTKDGKGVDKLEQAIAAELTNVLTCLSEDGQQE